MGDAERQELRPAPPGCTVEVGGHTFRAARLGPHRVVSVRHVGPYPAVGQTWDRLREFAARWRVTGPGTRAIGIVYDDPTTTPPERIRYDACLTVSESIEAVFARPDLAVAPGLRTEEIDSGPAWVGIHVGSYDRLAEVYARAADSGPFRERGLVPPRVRPPIHESYLNDPRSTPPDRLLTEVYFPFARADVLGPDPDGGGAAP